MFKIIFAAFLLQLFCHPIECLKCYQGQQKVSPNVTGSPMDCPIQAYSCIASVDYNQGIITRACASTNCSFPGGYNITYSPICINSTGYPPQTFCCCYGDGCNVYTNLGNPSPPIVPPTNNASISYPAICTGVWGNWSEWSGCPSALEPIFDQLTAINQRMRFRKCLPQPAGCTPNSGIVNITCSGNHWEQSPCVRTMPMMPAVIAKNST